MNTVSTDAVRNRVDLVELVGKIVPLKKRGAEFWGCCPFHQEKSPSFHIQPAKQLWKCFGCGAGGDVFNFVMQLEKCDFKAALAKLAAGVNLSVPAPAVRYKPVPTVTINAAAIWRGWRERTLGMHVQVLAVKLGVSVASLDLLGCCRANEYQAYAFPMRRAGGKIVGLRLRNLAGDQWAVKGSHAGLAIPDLADFLTIDPLYVCEGFSDVAAMLTLRLPAIGRPSCLGCEDMVADFVKLNKVRRVVVVADSDPPGQRGADKLQQALPVLSTIFTPCRKDIRDFLLAGGTAKMIENAVRDLLFTMPNRCSRKD